MKWPLCLFTPCTFYGHSNAPLYIFFAFYCCRLYSYRQTTEFVYSNPSGLKPKVKLEFASIGIPT